MSTKKSTIVVDSEGRSWDLDDFDLDSCGVEAREGEVFEPSSELGYTPEDVNEMTQDRQALYLASKPSASEEKP